MKTSTKWLTIGAIAGGAAALTGAAVATYALAVRPRILRWGATDDEVARVLPGDSLVEKPRMSVTRALTIDAPIDKVWPWLAQIGKGRGGFYSYEFIENQMLGLDIHNADAVLPEHQAIGAGDHILFADSIAPEVVMLQRSRMIVLHGDTRTAKPGEAPKMRPGDYLNVTWGFYLESLTPDKTRLVERMRLDYNPNLRNNVFYSAFLEPGSFVMERRMLLGIKARAEGKLNAKPAARRLEFKRPALKFNIKEIHIDEPGNSPPARPAEPALDPVAAN